MAEGQMTLSTYLELDACPGRITEEEATRAAADAKHVAALAEIIDNGYKNKSPYADGRSLPPSQWTDIPVVLPAGNYVLRFANLTSSDTDVTKCKAVFYNASNTAVSENLMLSRGDDITQEFVLTGTSKYMRLYCADNIPHSTGDVVQYTGCMICTKADWDISTAYVPFKEEDGPRLAPSGNATNRAAEILEKLNRYGECILEDGVYYCSALDMPAGTVLSGCGKRSVIRIVSGASYCVSILKNNTIRNVCFSGGVDAPADVTTEGASLGTQHGIYLVANADGQGHGTEPSSTNMVTGCWFENFDGSGFYAENTGTGLDNGVIMSDCRFFSCKVGINANYLTEYSKYSNCIIHNCNVAAINGGGNNVFIGCTFHGVRGFVIDNSSANLTNSGHGSCIGCTFNHINKMNHQSAGGGGLAIDLKYVSNGFLFDTCQIWYGAISVNNSRAVHFSDCLIGGDYGTTPPVITVSGSYPAWFDGCTFYKEPVISINSGTRFDACYLYTTGDKYDPNPAPIMKQLVDENPKNKLPIASATGAAGQSVDIECDIPPGDYVIFFSSLSTTHSGTTTCRATFIDSGGSWASAHAQMVPGNNTYLPVTITANAKKFRIIPASTVGGTAGTDVVSFTGAMVCTKDAFAVSQAYVPYHPSLADMWAAIQAL